MNWWSILTSFYLLYFYFVSFALSACPSGVNNNCECSEEGNGFSIDCHGINSELNDLLTPLEKIHIERLSVLGAYWPLLKRLPKLSVRVIQLVNCGIEDVEQTTFQSVGEQLEELVLINNSLTSLPDFGRLPKLLSLNLRYNKITHLLSSGLKKMTNLVQLRLDGNQICNLPKSFLRPVKNTLELLDLSGNCLERVPSKNLRNLPRLLYLDLSDNKISAIEDSEFMNLPHLKELRINNNLLTEIGKSAFNNVPRLRHMYLQNNRLTEFDTSEMIEGLEKLEVLDISNNHLLEVPLLKELPNLILVNLERNRISRTDSYTFSGSHRLRYLTLQNNQISYMAPHTFSRLHGLTHLLLANNALRYIDRDLFCGMENLEQLSLRNNSLNELENYTFTGIPSLKMLDLSYNGLHKIASATFKPLERVMWIDLSNNVLTTLEKGTFEDPIPNIILYGNPINCDEKIEWLVQYIVLNRVRIHLPFQPEVMCAAPKKYTSVRVRDYLARKANDTLNAMTAALRMAAGSPSDKDFINNIIPASVRKFLPHLERNEKNPYSDVPVIGAITKTLPGLRNIPGLNYIPKATGERVETVQSLNSAIEKISSPLIRVATGESESMTEIDQVVKAIPELAANLPGVKDMDLSKLPPHILLQVMRGEPIPGIEKEVMEKMLKEHTAKMYAAAIAAKDGHPLIDEVRYLPQLETLPREVVEEMMKGGTLPYLTKEQVSAIKYYYMKKAVVAITSGKMHILPKGIIKPHLMSLIEMLPPNYDANKIPVDVLETVMKGKIPDINALPSDLRDYIMNGPHGVETSLSADELLRSRSTVAPVTPKVELYDINKVGVDLIKEDEEAARKDRLRFYSGVLLCVVAVLSSFVLFLLFLYMRKRRAMLADNKLGSFYSDEASRQQETLVQTPRNCMHLGSPQRPQTAGPNQITYSQYEVTPRLK